MKRCTVIFAPEAKNDLERLYDWIADAVGPVIALSYIDRIEAYCLGLNLGSERASAVACGTISARAYASPVSRGGRQLLL